MTGKQEIFGGAPAKHTIWLADYWGGMMGAQQILAALYYRDKVSGEGTFIEYSQVHGVTRQLEYALPLYGRHGIVRERWARPPAGHGGQPPSNGSRPGTPLS